MNTKVNTKIYKSVYSLAEQLLDADQRGDQVAFDAHYAVLKAICINNENTDKDHPEQWETLADFTASFDEAILGYEKALTKATAINAKDHMASIAFSMAMLQIELGQTDAAIRNLQNAKISANKSDDKELKAEIDAMLAQQLAAQ